MGVAVKQLFMSLTILFTVIESIMKTFLHLAKAGEGIAATFEDKSVIDRKVERAQLLLASGMTEADLNPVVSNATTSIQVATKAIAAKKV